MEILLTGATGGVGSHVLAAFMKKHYRVTCAVRDPSKGEHLVSQYG